MSFVGIKDLMCTLHGIRQGLKFHLLLFLPKPKLSFFNFWKLLEWEQEGEGFCTHLQAGCGSRAQWWNHWAGCRFCPTEWEGLPRRSRSTGPGWRRLGHRCWTWGKAGEATERGAHSEVLGVPLGVPGLCPGEGSDCRRPQSSAPCSSHRILRSAFPGVLVSWEQETVVKFI